MNQCFLAIFSLPHSCLLPGYSCRRTQCVYIPHPPSTFGDFSFNTYRIVISGKLKSSYSSALIDRIHFRLPTISSSIAPQNQHENYKRAKIMSSAYSPFELATNQILSSTFNIGKDADEHPCSCLVLSITLNLYSESSTSKGNLDNINQTAATLTVEKLSSSSENVSGSQSDSPDRWAYALTTSGTTGKQKQVWVSEEALSSNLASFLEHVGKPHSMFLSLFLT